MKSCRNDMVATTTIVTLSTDPAAGNMNNQLFPPPVRIIANTRGVPDTMASNAGFCTPRNTAWSQYNRRACCSTSTSRICFYRHIFACLSWMSNCRCTIGSAARVCHADWKPKNRCQSILTLRNMFLSLTVTVGDSVNNNPYIMSSMYRLWPDCSAMVSSNRRICGGWLSCMQSNASRTP